MGRKIYSLLFLLFVFPVFVLAQNSDAKLAEIDAYAQQVMKDWNQPGMAIAVVKDGKTIFAKGYGVKKIESSPAATYARLYRAVKNKDSEAIKREMSADTQSFAEGVAQQQKKTFNEVIVNGFTATTFSDTLPKTRDLRSDGVFAALEIYNEKIASEINQIKEEGVGSGSGSSDGKTRQESNSPWEDLPFIFENGDWKLAIGEIFNGRYKKPKENIERTDRSNMVDENTVFAIASNSKAFTTAAISILIDEKKIGSWDDKVSKYLPEFRLYNSYVTEDLTLRDITSHRVGLDTFSGDLLWYETKYTNEEILNRVKYLKPTRGFRTGFGYQNLMFIAAGRVIEKVSGKSWSAFVKEKILDPLGMKRTTATIKNLPDNAAFPHNESGGTLRALHRGNVDGADAAAGLNSSVADLTKWIRLQLGKGEFEGKRIFSEKNSWEMWQPAVVLPISENAAKANPTRHFNTYGLGWNLFDYQGKKIVTHSGGLDGMLSRTVLIPESNIGFVVLSNSEYPAYHIMYQKMLDVFTDAPKKDYNAETLKRVADNKKTEAEEAKKLEDSRVKNTKPSLNLKDYSGTFTGELYGDATITEENGKLVLRMLPSPNFVADLEHWHYDTFKIKWRPSVAYDFPAGFVTFNIDKNGKASDFSIDQPNNDFWFYELEFKRKVK